MEEGMPTLRDQTKIKIKIQSRRDRLLLTVDLLRHSLNSRSSSGESENSVEAERLRENAKEDYQNNIRRHPPTKQFRKRDARTVESLNANNEQSETASHPRECYEVLILLMDPKGKVVAVCGLIDAGCTHSIILKIMLKRRDLNVPVDYGTPIESILEFQNKEHGTSELRFPQVYQC